MRLSVTGFSSSTSRTITLRIWSWPERQLDCRHPFQSFEQKKKKKKRKEENRKKEDRAGTFTDNDDGSPATAVDGTPSALSMIQGFGRPNGRWLAGNGGTHIAHYTADTFPPRRMIANQCHCRLRIPIRLVVFNGML